MQREPRQIARDIQQLAAVGWLELTQLKGSGKICFSLRDPSLLANKHILRRVRRRVRRPPLRNEALMQEYLSLFIDSVEIDDEAVAVSAEEQQVDADHSGAPFDLSGTAPEFDHPQSNVPMQVSAVEDAAHLEARDFIKSGIRGLKGSTPVVIRSDDIGQEAMQRKASRLQLDEPE